MSPDGWKISRRWVAAVVLRLCASFRYSQKYANDIWHHHLTSTGLRIPLLDVHKPHVSEDENKWNNPKAEALHYRLDRSKINAMKVIMCGKTVWSECYTSAFMVAVSWQVQRRHLCSQLRHPLQFKKSHLFQLCLIGKTWFQRVIMSHDFKLSASANSCRSGATWWSIIVMSINGQIGHNLLFSVPMDSQLTMCLHSMKLLRRFSVVHVSS